VLITCAQVFLQVKATMNAIKTVLIATLNVIR